MAAMSIFFIVIIASKARFDHGGHPSDQRILGNDGEQQTPLGKF
jgi:hypothetical protein